MVDKRIGISVDTQITGNENVERQAASLDKLNSGWAQFNDLRTDASTKFPDDMRRQNAYIQQQISLLKEMETVGSRERTNTLRYQRSLTRNKNDIKGIDKEIARERARHIESSVTATEAKASRMQWALDQGVGEPTKRESDLMAQLTGGGIRGGGMGIAQAGIGAATSAVTGKMKGMSLGSKVGLGLGAGLGIGAITLIVGGLKEGWDIYKQLAPQLLELSAISGKLPEDAEKYRKAFQRVALDTATATNELIQYEKTWMRILGGRQGGMESAIDISQAFGIDKGLGTEFTASMGMTGYNPNANVDILKRAISDGMVSGIGHARLPEYLREVQTVTNAVLRTAVTADPAMISAYAREIGTLGIPFQGERGAGILTSLQQGMQGGMGFMAAKRALGKDASLFDIKFLQQQGLADTDMLAGYIELFGDIAGIEGKTGKDLVSARKKQAFLLGQETGIPLKALYNPSEAMDSLLEMSKGALRDLKPGEIPDYTGKISEFKKEFGFESQQAAIAKEIVKINASADLFESGARIFNGAVNKFADASLEPEFEPTPIEYEATNQRDFSTGVRGITAPTPKKGMVRGQYR